jgi:hypothetical protein
MRTVVKKKNKLALEPKLANSNYEETFAPETQKTSAP